MGKHVAFAHKIWTFGNNINNLNIYKSNIKDYRFDVLAYLKCVYRPSGDAKRFRILE